MEVQQSNAREKRLADQLTEAREARTREEEEMQKVKEERDRGMRRVENSEKMAKVLAETEEALKRKVLIY